MLCPRRKELGNASVFKLPEEDTWREDGTCSYCGSLHPDKAIELMSDGVQVTPTDKNYKMYLGGQKVYFQHFEKSHIDEFIEIVNGGFARMAYPGHFYVLPFFVRRANEPR